MVIVVFSTSAKANYDVDILGGSIPGIPAQRLGVPQEVVGRSHVKIKRSFNENLSCYSVIHTQVSSAVCFLLSPGASFIRFNNILYDEIIHLGNNFVCDGHVCNTFCPVLLKLLDV